MGTSIFADFAKPFVVFIEKYPVARRANDKSDFGVRRDDGVGVACDP